MPAKGIRLYKIETVEVVERGTREEPGYFYEYLDPKPQELADAAKPRSSTVQPVGRAAIVAKQAPAKPPAPAVASNAPPAVDDSPTLRIGKQGLSEVAEVPAEEVGDDAALPEGEPVSLSDFAIEGVEVVETEAAYDLDSQLVPTVVPDIVDPESLEADYESEELIPIIEDGDEDASGFEDEDDAGFLGDDTDFAEDFVTDGDIEAPFADDGDADIDAPGAESDDVVPFVVPQESEAVAVPVVDGISDSELDEVDGINLDEIPVLPDDIAPLEEAQESAEPSADDSGADPSADETSPERSTMQEDKKPDTKRGTGRLENTRVRTGRVGGTGRAARSSGSAEAGEDRFARPIATQQGMSAKTHKRITVASYTVVALVVLIIGGHTVLSHLGIISRDSGSGDRQEQQRQSGGGGGSDFTDNEISAEERLIERQVSQAHQNFGRSQSSFAAAERAREINDREEFEARVIQFLRAYWQVRYYLASASRTNIEIGGGRIDTGEVPMVRSLTQSQREEIARQSQRLGVQMRNVRRWVSEFELDEIFEDERVTSVRDRWEQINAEIEQTQVDQGDVEALVDRLIEEWLELDEIVTVARARIERGEAEDPLTEAKEAIRTGLLALTRYYEAVKLDEHQHTEARRQSTTNLMLQLRELTEVEGVGSLSDFEEHEAYRQARREAIGD